MHRLAHITLIAACLGVFLCGPAGAEPLTLADARALSWPAALPMILTIASDAVYGGGPDYHGESPDPWLSNSDVVEDGWDFTLSVRNSGLYPVDDVILLVAWRGETFTALAVDGITVPREEFYQVDGAPFGPTGNRPGSGEAELYATAERITFLRIGKGLEPMGTLQVPVSVAGGRVGCEMHFDTYGVRRSQVCCSANDENDVTLRPRMGPTSASEETWSSLKNLFAL